jgi:hypothetical protein
MCEQPNDDAAVLVFEVTHTPVTCFVQFSLSPVHSGSRSRLVWYD